MILRKKQRNGECSFLLENSIALTSEKERIHWLVSGDWLHSILSLISALWNLIMHLKQMKGNRGMHLYGHCERGSGWSYVYVNLVRSVLESLVPNFTLGLSWNIYCCLRPWFSLFHLLYHLCGLLYAYLIYEGVKGRGEYGVGGSYFVLWHFFWVSLNNHLICEMGRRGGKLYESCNIFLGEEVKSNLSFSTAQEVAEKAVGISMPLYIYCEKVVSCFILRVVWVRILGTTSKIHCEND